MSLDEYFQLALRDAHIRQTKDHYSMEGYVEVEDPGPFDLLLKKGATSMAFCLITLPLTPQEENRLHDLKNLAKEKRFEFRTISLVGPPARHIEIDWLEDALYDHFQNNFPSEIDRLSSHTHIENVDVEITSFDVSGMEAQVDVEGTLQLSLQYGSGADQDNDMGLQISDSASFRGHLVLDMQAKSIVSAELHIQTRDL